MTNDVYIYESIKQYNNKKFNPSKVYSELKNIDFNIESDKDIYNDIRNLFITMKLDKKNIGTDKWNPFKDFIKENDKVVIKPNFVKHINNCINGNLDSLVTNIALIRPVIDYCLLALNNTGSIILGDAPVQECDFDELMKKSKIGKMIKEYQTSCNNIFLMDFRKNEHEDLECRIVNIGKNSELCEVDEYANKYAITNYNLKYMHQHHKDGLHEYLIPQVILDANVIINMPKPKTHRKAGITACMKNLVGINGKKEYLPHHRNGSIKHHGDEYPENNILKDFKSFTKNYSYKKNSIVKLLNKISSLPLRIFNLRRYQEGSWYGNDTIWRTILDLNKLLLYSNSKGKLTSEKKRVEFNICDMIISGEGEGPLVPTNKKVGYIVASFNALNCDNTICKIMGFNPDKIKYITQGYKLTKFKLVDNYKYNNYDNKGNKIKNIHDYSVNFIPTDGWKDYLIER